MMSNKILKFIVCLIALFVMLEAASRLPNVKNVMQQEKRRIMLFDKGENFQNIEKHFRYVPNKVIRSETYYILKDLSYNECSSVVFTNNMGLVQKRDIEHGSNVNLILGDSFAEGQGSNSWFYTFDEHAFKRGINFVNGAILGTSPLQWEMLKDTLQKEFNLTYSSVNIILLGGAITGGPWQFSDDGLHCLRTADCPNPLGDFFGYDFSGKDEMQIRNDALTLHTATSLQPNASKEIQGVWAQIKNIMKGSVFLHKSIAYLKECFAVAEPQAIATTPLMASNLDAIRRLVNAGEKQGFIVLVTTKHEAGAPPKWDPHSLMFMEYAQQHDLKYEICELNKADFYPVDGHPHSGGYEKIRKCIEKISRL